MSGKVNEEEAFEQADAELLQWHFFFATQCLSQAFSGGFINHNMLCIQAIQEISHRST